MLPFPQNSGLSERPNQGMLRVVLMLDLHPKGIFHPTPARATLMPKMLSVERLLAILLKVIICCCILTQYGHRKAIALERVSLGVTSSDESVTSFPLVACFSEALGTMLDLNVVVKS